MMCFDTLVDLSSQVNFAHSAKNKIFIFDPNRSWIETVTAHLLSATLTSTVSLLLISMLMNPLVALIYGGKICVT